MVDTPVLDDDSEQAATLSDVVTGVALSGLFAGGAVKGKHRAGAQAIKGGPPNLKNGLELTTEMPGARGSEWLVRLGHLAQARDTDAHRAGNAFSMHKPDA